MCGRELCGSGAAEPRRRGSDSARAARAAFGLSSLTPRVHHPQANYVVPADLATNKVAYGPISGQSLGSRLIVAYEAGKLAPRAGKAALTLCSACGADGHRAASCAAPSGA